MGHLNISVEVLLCRMLSGNDTWHQPMAFNNIHYIILSYSSSVSVYIYYTTRVRNCYLESVAIVLQLGALFIRHLVLVSWQQGLLFSRGHCPSSTRFSSDHCSSGTRLLSTNLRHYYSTVSTVHQALGFC